MGPTNVALVKLFQADQKLREAQGRLDATTRNVRIQERRVKDLTDRINATSNKLKEQQAHAGAMDLDLKSRDAHIEKLRSQQQLAKTNKEYQTFLVEINTAKLDRNKIEEEAIKTMEANEKLASELKELNAQLEGEKTKLSTMQAQITDRTAALQKEIDDLRPQRESAAGAVPAKAREAFDRLADRFEGEALAAISKPNARVEEYCCTVCNMDLVRDVYNRLHSRDEIVFCPSCRRILYIPEDLTPELAVHKPKERKERPGKAGSAAVGRQTAAVDVLRSIEVEADESPDPPGKSAGQSEQPEAQRAEPEAPEAPQRREPESAEPPPQG